MSRYLTRRCQATLIASAAVLAVMAVAPASACKRYPVVPDLAKQVRDTDAIVLARVIGIRMGRDKRMRRDYAEYRFKVLKVLKGPAVGSFVRTEGWPHPPSQNDNSDYDAHRDPRFWTGKIDRGSPQGIMWGCLFNQTFTMGRTYLIFRGQQTRRAAELIKSKNDRWLATVRRLTVGK